jgi:hypothetical protein
MWVITNNVSMQVSFHTYVLYALTFFNITLSGLMHVDLQGDHELYS